MTGMRATALVAGVLSLALALVGLSFASGVVEVRLSAQWESTPIAMEASEFSAELNPSSFWTYLDAFDKHWNQRSNDTEEAEWFAAKQAAGVALQSDDDVTSPSNYRALISYALGVRAHAVAVAAHRQTADSIWKEYLSVSGQPSSQPLPVTFVVVDRRAVLLDAQSLQRYFSTHNGNSQSHTLSSIIIDADHVFEAASSPEVAHEAILFGDLRTSEFHRLLAALKMTAADRSLRFAVRHCWISSSAAIGRGSDEAQQGMLVQGYGVELRIKNLEYKAIDDSSTADEAAASAPAEDTVLDPNEEVEGVYFGRLVDRRPHLKSELLTLRDKLISSQAQEADLFRQLRRWEMKDLGLQAAYRISTANEPLQLLREISHNFPRLATSLARVVVPSSYDASDAALASQFFGAGSSAIFLNGRWIDVDRLNPFELSHLIATELVDFQMLESIGVPSTVAKALLRGDVGDAQSPLDASAQDAASAPLKFIIDHPTAVQYLNDLQRDTRYAGFSPSITSVLEPVWPGRLLFARQNFVTIVAVTPPLSNGALWYYSMAYSFIQGRAPVHIGFVFDVDNVELNPYLGTPRPKGHKLSLEPLSHIMASLFYTAIHMPGGSMTQAMAFLKDLTDSSRGDPQAINLMMLATAFKRATAMPIAKAYTTRQLLMAADNFVIESAEFVQEAGLRHQGDYPLVFVNGAPIADFSPETWQSSVLEVAAADYITLGRMVATDRLHEGDNIYAELLRESNALPSYHRVLVQVPHATQLDTSRVVDLRRLPFAQQAAVAVDRPIPVSHVVVCDLSVAAGLRLARAAVASLRSGGDESDEKRIATRVALVPCDVNGGNIKLNNERFAVVYDLLTDVSGQNGALEKLVRQLKSWLAEASAEIDSATVAPEQAVASAQAVASVGAVARIRSALGKIPLVRGRMGVITNGATIWLQNSDDASFLADELWPAWSKLQYDAQRIATLSALVESLPIPRDGADATAHRSDLLMSVSSLLHRRLRTNARAVPLPAHFVAAVKRNSVNGAWDESRPLDWFLILNPLSRHAQKASPLLLDALQHFGSSMNVALCSNPMRDISELPLQTFFSYAVDSSPEFDAAGRLRATAINRISNLPESALLTLGLDAPHGWLAQPLRTRYDLDNILMKDVVDRTSTGIPLLEAEFDLTHLLIEGQCEGGVSGIELNLHDNAVPDGQLATAPHEDTLVMKSLNYFQLKANPGLWKVTLAPGRSATVYQFDSAEVPRIFVNSYTQPDTEIRVRKRAGFEHVSLLHYEVEPASAGDPTRASQVIHIFSMASGHLYERLMRIMMLSVIEHTTSPVKFWLFENFLSPKFKELIPHMAREYGFEYEMVTYAWPVWLNAQTEKQRVIWAYKILFLDVLFPLNVKRVVFVDADQVVRADLAELRDLDMKGHVYGYVPMCDSRVEMDGFRFWKSGYWKDHLNGRPYHISALYVIDLERFRLADAGNLLRETYHRLSQDKNSLANLDQDLPNFLQLALPIYSLDKDWLWCETWCDDESKKTAKTIDLCNNPLTKASKLENAVRIVPEWKSYDDRLRAFEERVAQNGLVTSGGKSQQPDQAVDAIDAAADIE